MKKLIFLRDFFYYYPSLLYALFFLLGLSSYLFSSFFLILLSFLIFIFTVVALQDKKRSIFTFFCFFLAFFYASYFYSEIKKIDTPIYGTGYFKITSIKEGFNFNRKYYIYKGTLKYFQTKKKTIKNINVSVFSKKKFSSNFLYKIEGDLILKHPFLFQLNAKNWQKDKKILNFAHSRYLLKKNFEKFLKKSIFDKHVANFLYSLITGESSSLFMQYSFSKIGISHVLAISGFHFSIFTLFFFYFLKFFIPKKQLIYVLIIIVSIYFLFVGPLISVQRTFMMIQMSLIASLINRRYLALNTLGISLIIILLIDPLNITKIGFQLSFLSSFAILLTFPMINQLTSKILKRRTLLEKNELKLASKIGDKLITYIREIFSICLAVNIFIVPVILYHFHKFPYVSFLYNLFIPFLVGISMLGVILGFIFNFIIPPLGLWINFINTYFTKFILKLITYPPASLQFYLRCNDISFKFVVLYLGSITIFFLILRYYLKNQQTPEYLHYI